MMVGRQLEPEFRAVASTSIVLQGDQVTQAGEGQFDVCSGVAGHDVVAAAGLGGAGDEGGSEARLNK